MILFQAFKTCTEGQVRVNKAMPYLVIPKCFHALLLDIGH